MITIKKPLFNILLLLCAIYLTSNCYSQPIKRAVNTNDQKQIKVGAERIELYLPLLKNKKIAIVGNQTSLIGKTHLVDTLISLKVKVKKIFSPEHGFRGTADAGEHIKNQKDSKTGLPVISLYGKHHKPQPSDLKGIDVIVFDIQDVGARFYTYLSTLHYIMEACAENKKSLIVLDRPNPNGFYIDGPVMEEKYMSFVGLHPVPIVYGLTIGEYAQMINGEGWLKNKAKCDLEVITLENYSHKDHYQLPIKPSPNLPDPISVYLYPSLALFEGTIVSVGRGTDFPFRVIGHPNLKNADFTFIPKSKPGASSPMYKDSVCYGFDLRSIPEEGLKRTKKMFLNWLIETYENTPAKENYFNNYFNSLAGNSLLKEQIINKVDESEIRKSWEPSLNIFKEKRKKYLLYPDFE